MIVPRLFGALACVLLTGCSLLWNAANRSGPEADVRGLLEAAALVPRPLECRMAGSADSLRLPSGSAFEYLLFTIDESTGQACLQVSYSYG